MAWPSVTSWPKVSEDCGGQKARGGSQRKGDRGEEAGESNHICSGFLVALQAAGLHFGCPHAFGYVCVRVWMDGCLFVCERERERVGGCEYVCECMHAVSECVCVCARMCVYVHAHVSVCVCTHVCVRAYMIVCVRA